MRSLIKPVNEAWRLSNGSVVLFVTQESGLTHWVFVDEEGVAITGLLIIFVALMTILTEVLK
jgi:hypothetical protein